MIRRTTPALRILVTGASGFIGRHLVPFLAAGGHEAVPLARGCGAVPADLTRIGDWPDWPAGIDAVVHLAALNPTWADPAVRDVPALHRVNVEGTRALAARAAAEGVKRLVFLSTANVHRSKGLEPVSEADEPHPQSAYAASKLAAEAALRQVVAETGIETCVLRAPPVYGRGGRGAVAGLAWLARLPLPLPLNDPRRRRSMLALGNCLDAITLALSHPEAAGGTFLLADAVPLSLGEMVEAMRRGMGRRALLLPFPGAPLRGLARMTRRSEAFDRLFEAFVLDCRRIEARLGWRPPISSEEAFADMMRQG